MRNINILKSISLLTTVFLSVSLSAQNLTVKGRVTDSETGEPVIGAAVGVESSHSGTTTDVDGNFVLNNVAKGQEITYAHLSYETRKVTFDGRTSTLNIMMNPSTEQLEESILIGYGSVRKSDLTSAISVVTDKDINKTPISSIEQALQGNASGVVVINTSAEPGGEVALRIRGGSSISGDNEPLIVIDNVPSDKSALSMLSPSDVAGIEILKDAAATAIYGSRGANGVMMITTKSGTEGKAQLKINAKVGISVPRYRIQVLDSPDYVDYDNFSRMIWGVSSFKDLQPDTLATTDWQSLLLRDVALRQEYTASLGGGTKNARYYISGGFLDEEGILKNSSNVRYNLRTKFNLRLSEKTRLDINASLTRQEQEKVPSGGNGATTRMLMQKPTSSVNGSSTGDGMYLDEETGEWKVINQEAAKSMNSNIWNKKTAVTFNAEFAWNITKPLSFHSTAAYSYEDSNNYGYVLRSIYNKESNIDKNNTASRSTSKNSTLTNENYLNYSNTFSKKHYVSLMAGQSWSRTAREGFGISVNRFDTDYFMWDNLNAGSIINKPSTSRSAVSHLSFFTRAIYTYDKRYTVSALMRADGSSRFGQDSKFGYFPAASFSWNVHNEKWMKKVKWINELKPRVSWGITGNDKIGEYQSLSLLSSEKIVVGDKVYNGMVASQIGNTNLQWETTHQYNFGIDLSMFKSRVKTSVEAYYKQTYNLLYAYRLPQTTGFSTVMANIGNVDNMGVEFDLSTKNIVKKNFSWTTDFNIGWNQSRVIDLGGNDNVVMYYHGDNVNQNMTHLIIGKPLGTFMGYETEPFKDWNDVYDSGSVWVEDPLAIPTQPGMLKYKDQNGDGIIDERDKVCLGQALPTIIGGFTNTFTLKNFTLVVFFNYSIGNKVVNTNVTKFELYQGGNNNSYRQVLDCFRPENPIIGDSGYSGGYYPIPSSYSSQSVGRQYTSNIIDKWIQDGSYLRLKTLSLSYKVPDKLTEKCRIKDLIVGVTASNLWTLTSYRGFDPETSSSVGSSNSRIGIDQSSYPAVKTVLFNLNLNF